MNRIDRVKGLPFCLTPRRSQFLVCNSETRGKMCGLEIESDCWLRIKIPMGKAARRKRRALAAISKASNPLHGGAEGPGQKSELLRIRQAQKQPGLSPRQAADGLRSVRASCQQGRTSQSLEQGAQT